MNYQSSKRIKTFSIIVVATLLMSFFGCKKEITEVNVDAYKQLDAKLEYAQGVYSLQFTLQDYPYEEVGVRMGISKTMFYQNSGLVQTTANEVAADRFAVFYNTLSPNTLYYYQIYVKDPQTKGIIYSDVFSFMTHP